MIVTHCSNSVLWRTVSHLRNSRKIPIHSDGELGIIPALQQAAKGLRVTEPAELLGSGSCVQRSLHGEEEEGKQERSITSYL